MLALETVVQSTLTGKTIRYIKNTFLSPTSKQNSNHTLLIANFAHSIKMIDNAE